jgi:high-affinity nickel permease
MSITADQRTDRAIDGDRTPARQNQTRRLVTETKAAFKTTEFFAFIVVVVAILVSAATIKGTGGHVDVFKASQAWLYVAIVTFGYMVSRGIAKSGSHQPYDEDRS